MLEHACKFSLLFGAVAWFGVMLPPFLFFFCLISWEFPCEVHTRGGLSLRVLVRDTRNETRNVLASCTGTTAHLIKNFFCESWGGAGLGFVFC